jgi:hypothetical protein
MAMSNWDLMAWDDKGNSDTGSFTHNFTQINIYKNWVYVCDEKAHNKYTSFKYPTIMSIHDGWVHYNGCDIITKRGKQDGIYVVVRVFVNHDAKYYYGIGCCAYRGNKCVGVTKTTYEDYMKWLRKLNKEEYVKVTAPKKLLRVNQGDMIIGDIKKHSTLIGKASDTLISQLLGKKK